MVILGRWSMASYFSLIRIKTRESFNYGINEWTVSDCKFNIRTIKNLSKFFLTTLLVPILILYLFYLEIQRLRSMVRTFSVSGSFLLCLQAGNRFSRPVQHFRPYLDSPGGCARASGRGGPASGPAAGSRA